MRQALDRGRSGLSRRVTLGAGALSIGVAAIAATPMRARPITVVVVLAGLGLWATLAVARHRRTEHEERTALVATDLPEGTAQRIESHETWGSQRRTLLKTIGVGTLGAIPLMIAPRTAERLIRDVVTTDARGLETGAGKLAAAPAIGKGGRIRQWSMIIDLRHCDGCQSQGTPPKCTLACIEGHFIPEPMQWIEVYEGPLTGGGTQFIPTPCQQCQNPPCVNVCPVGATFSTPEGTVLIDQGRCIGCRICMAACPYDRRFFNWGEPPVPPEALLADYAVDHQAPALRGTVMKCDFCPDMARAGMLPFCIQACPQNAMYYGDLEEDVATNGQEIVRFSRFISDNSAYRLKEHLGTEPRVFYIPGHGELAGRDSRATGRKPTVWPWVDRAEGSTSWDR